MAKKHLKFNSYYILGVFLTVFSISATITFMDAFLVDNSVILRLAINALIAVFIVLGFALFSTRYQEKQQDQTQATPDHASINSLDSVSERSAEITSKKTEICDDALSTERDIQQKAISQKASAEKLAALGMMAAGVAHEINNPLGGILLYANLVIEDMPHADANRENMIKIIKQTKRCKEIVQNLLNFAKAPTGSLQPLCVNAIIQNTLQLLKDQPSFFKVNIITDLEKTLPAVLGDNLKLEEVFLNLILNAADAMKAQGTITIQTRKTPENLIRIILTDTGSGIDKSCLPHIFEPFFTTKDPGQGTGLGLSITYGIIREHKGSIHVESEQGKGTSFLILLPVHGAPSL